MIQSIQIEYQRIGSAEWKRYRCVNINAEESGGGEILLLEDAFGEFFKFRLTVYAYKPIHVRTYDRNVKGGWSEPA